MAANPLPKIANACARHHVERKSDFEGSNLFAVSIVPDVYVVYSYGKHWPLIACVHGKWYVNTEKTSPTTARHLSQCRPSHTCTEVDLVGMRAALNATS